MPALILYLLKANVALALFYMAYHVALRRLTFYHLNRLFLVFGILFATLYPLIDVSELFRQHQELASTYMGTLPAWVTATAAPAHAPAFNPWDIPLFVFWLGAGVMATRLLLQFISLYRIHAASAPGNHKGIGFRRSRHITQAFSFWQAIYVNPAQHKQEELESILRHEQVHVKGWHTLDVLLAEWSTVFYWFNPGAWLLKNAVKENLEFIADQHVVRTGVDRKAYQYLLLKVVGAPEPSIATQFNFLTIKKRIAMMNKKQSSLLHVARYAVLVPLIAVPILFVACSEEEALLDDTTQTTKDTAMQKPVIQRIVTEERVDTLTEYRKAAPNVLIKNNLDLEYTRWAAPNILTIKLRGGQQEIYNLDNEQDLTEASRKYGVQLSAPPPPPPPMPSDVEAYIPDASNQHEDYKAFLKRNPEVKQVGWISKVADGSAQSLIVVEFKAGGSELYDLKNEKSISAAEAKYGKLPVLPPPPPPVREEDK